MKPTFNDSWREQKEQQRSEDDYWGKGSEPIKRNKGGEDDINN